MSPRRGVWKAHQHWWVFSLPSFVLDSKSNPPLFGNRLLHAPNRGTIQWLSGLHFTWLLLVISANSPSEAVRCGATPCVLDFMDLTDHVGVHGSKLAVSLDAVGQPMLFIGERVLVRRNSGQWEWEEASESRPRSKANLALRWSKGRTTMKLVRWAGYSNHRHLHRVVLETRNPKGKLHSRIVDEVQTAPGRSARSIRKRSESCHTGARTTNAPLAIVGDDTPLLLFSRTVSKRSCRAYRGVKHTRCECDFVDAQGSLFVARPNEEFRIEPVSGTDGLLLEVGRASAVQDSTGNIHLAFLHTSREISETAYALSKTRPVLKAAYLKVGPPGAVEDSPTRNVPAPPDWPATPGRLDPSEVQRVLGKNLGRIQRCIERMLVTHPDQHGRLVARWIVSPNGTVERVEVTKTTPDDNELRACLVRTILNWHFRPPQGGPATVQHAFSF
jgi:hypothetical protein